MNATDNFKKVISQHLNGLAANDPLFAETLKKENKNINDCITYILNRVKESGCNGFEDEEIFGMAIHYYDEDDLKPGKSIDCQIVTNHKATNTAPTKNVTKPVAVKKQSAPKSEIFQASLFD